MQRERLERGPAAAWHAQPQPTARSEDTIVIAPWRGWWPASSRGAWWMAASHSDSGGCLCCWLFGSTVPLPAWAGPRSADTVCRSRPHRASHQTQRAVLLWSWIKWFLLLLTPEEFCYVWFHSGNFSCKPPHQQVPPAAFCLAILQPLLLPAEGKAIV